MVMCCCKEIVGLGYISCRSASLCYTHFDSEPYHLSFGSFAFSYLTIVYDDRSILEIPCDPIESPIYGALSYDGDYYEILENPYDPNVPNSGFSFSLHMGAYNVNRTFDSLDETHEGRAYYLKNGVRHYFSANFFRSDFVTLFNMFKKIYGNSYYLSLESLNA